MSITLQQVLNTLPAEWEHDLLPEIQAEIRKAGKSIIVLDDDPTGTQTMYDVPVLTNWSVEFIKSEFERKTPLFYILTNSRSLPKKEAENLATVIGKNLLDASKQAGRPFLVISRSDSTLRGHFPAEIDPLATELDMKNAVRVIIPAFFEGGRYTISDVHYVKEGEVLVPAGETPFAKDASFGYKASNLRQWVEEKTQGAVKADSVVSITLKDIRSGGPTAVEEKLSQCKDGSVCIMNAASYRDLEVLTLGLLRAEKAGKQFLYRTAASFIPVRAGVPLRPLVTKDQLNLPEEVGGLIVVGSYVPKTTEQLSHLLSGVNLVKIEIDVASLLSDAYKEKEINKIIQEAEAAIRSGADVVIYTSRKLITGNDAESSLAIGSKVSNSLVTIVKSITVRPRYILAKGGITSSETATEALEVKRATVVGQILPGIPVWRLGAESHFPDLIYIVFPGNVGGPEALKEAVIKLQK